MPLGDAVDQLESERLLGERLAGSVVDFIEGCRHPVEDVARIELVFRPLHSEPPVPVRSELLDVDRLRARGWVPCVAREQLVESVVGGDILDRECIGRVVARSREQPDGSEEGGRLSAEVEELFRSA
jgi:hypothetical protein